MQLCAPFERTERSSPGFGLRATRTRRRRASRTRALSVLTKIYDSRPGWPEPGRVFCASRVVVVVVDKVLTPYHSTPRSSVLSLGCSLFRSISFTHTKSFVPGRMWWKVLLYLGTPVRDIRLRKRKVGRNDGLSSSGIAPCSVQGPGKCSSHTTTTTTTTTH